MIAAACVAALAALAGVALGYREGYRQGKRVGYLYGMADEADGLELLTDAATYDLPGVDPVVHARRVAR